MTVLYTDLGRVRYGPALALQHRLHALRRAGGVGDVVLLLEHEPVITIGRGGHRGHILAPRDELARAGVEVFPVERGGDVTYHGPGQLVLYPILDLRARGKDVHRHVGDLEEIMIRTSQSFGVVVRRREGFPGAWRDQGKLGAVGIHVRNWITMHGLAFNVNLDPDGFQWIIPCGIAGAKAVSLADLAGHPVPMDEVREAMLAAVRDVLGVDLVPVRGEVISEWRTTSPSG